MTSDRAKSKLYILLIVAVALGCIGAAIPTNETTVARIVAAHKDWCQCSDCLNSFYKETNSFRFVRCVFALSGLVCAITYLIIKTDRWLKTDYIKGKCVYCGYSLEGLQGDLCPECGESLSMMRNR